MATGCVTDSSEAEWKGWDGGLDGDEEEGDEGCVSVSCVWRVLDEDRDDDDLRRGVVERADEERPVCRLRIDG